MSDNDLKLKQRLQPFIDALNSRLSIRASIMNHANLLLDLRSEGYKVDDLLEVSGCTYSRQSFSSALHEAKKKIHDNKIVHKRTEAIEKEEVLDIINKLSLEEWTNVLGYEINERILGTIIDLNLTPEHIVNLNLNNSNKLSNYLIEFKHQNKYSR